LAATKVQRTASKLASALAAHLADCLAARWVAYLVVKMVSRMVLRRAEQWEKVRAVHLVRSLADGKEIQ
jgi:hypothetical protein